MELIMAFSGQWMMTFSGQWMMTFLANGPHYGFLRPVDLIMSFSGQSMMAFSGHWIPVCLSLTSPLSWLSPMTPPIRIPVEAVELGTNLPRVLCNIGYPSETHLNSNLAKSILSITSVSIFQSVCNFAQSTTVILLCSVQNLKNDWMTNE